MLEANEKERATLLREREVLMKRMQPVIADPLHKAD